MPEHVQPVGLPEEVDRAVQIVGNRVRVAALLMLLRVERATATEIAGQLKVGRELVRQHLIELERLRIVEVDPPRSPEVRRHYFRVDRVALREVVDTLRVLAPDQP